MRRAGEKRPHGELRQSQVVSIFGPGAMLDLPKHSVLVAGLEYWSAGGEEIIEPRLARKLALLLDVPGVRLLTPPLESGEIGAPSTGIECFQFPEWFITQDVKAPNGEATSRSRMLVHRTALTRGKFIDRDKVRRPVVPVRFVRACRAGHIGDINWYQFVHSGPTDCAKQGRQLWIDERGTSGDLSEVWIRCECGKAERSMISAADPKQRALGFCDGSRIWLGPYSKETCGEASRLLIRTASNAYFPQKLTVISLPDRDVVVKAAVDAAWEYLEAVESADDVRYERKKARVKEALEGISDEEVFKEVQVRRGDTPADDKPVKVAELETLVSSASEAGGDRPHGIFFARTLDEAVWKRPWMAPIERVVLVHRLREVAAQAGFTRFESAAPDAQGELEVGVKRADLAREIKWLPAIENKGEGVFLQFNGETIEDWLDRAEVRERGKELDAGFQAWQREHPGSRRPFPGLQYLMLHSFSHMLVTALSLECGYPASAIRERIYAIPEIGYGVLLYTGSNDAEGTLGGLIQAARRIHELVQCALDQGELCSNDPVCAQHNPANTHEQRFLHGAACHGCLLIAETSCEQYNDFLDRALVVPTVDTLGAEFFTALS